MRPYSTPRTHVDAITDLIDVLVDLDRTNMLTPGIRSNAETAGGPSEKKRAGRACSSAPRPPGECFEMRAVKGPVVAEAGSKGDRSGRPARESDCIMPPSA